MLVLYYNFRVLEVMKHTQVKFEVYISCYFRITFGFGILRTFQLSRLINMKSLKFSQKKFREGYIVATSSIRTFAHSQVRPFRSCSCELSVSTDRISTRLHENFKCRRWMPVLAVCFHHSFGF